MDLATLHARLERFPRLPLSSTCPTPLERLERLTASVGARTGTALWIKRDDCLGPGMGGNKARKLEFLMAQAQRRYARRVVTFGGLQSNHARMTAVVARRMGIEPHLFYFERAPLEMEGNLLLNSLVDAKMHFIPLGNSGGMSIEATNRLVLVGKDLRGNPVLGASDTITVVYTGAVPQPQDFLVINEVHYNPLESKTSFLELYSRSTATPFDLSGFRLDGVGRIVEGTIKSPYFLDRQTRRWRHDGAPELDDVRFVMTVPENPPHPTPVVIFGHAIVTDRRFVLTIAGALAKKGFAAVSVDFPYHGERIACVEAGSLISFPNFLPQELQDTLADPRSWVREGAVAELDRQLRLNESVLRTKVIRPDVR